MLHLNSWLEHWGFMSVIKDCSVVNCIVYMSLMCFPDVKGLWTSAVV